MSPPGCPERLIAAVFPSQLRSLYGKGMMLKLACGHIQWEAGFDAPLPLPPGVTRPCLGGCYRPIRAMGENCN
jgi:hypothetical protein